jgi:hypothetical protein
MHHTYTKEIGFGEWRCLQNKWISVCINFSSRPDWGCEELCDIEGVCKVAKCSASKLGCPSSAVLTSYRKSVHNGGSSCCLRIFAKRSAFVNFFHCCNVLNCINAYWPIPVPTLSKTWVCGHSLAGNAGSNRGEGMDICLFLVLCVVRQRSLCRADHSSGGVLPTVVCLSVIMKPRQWGGAGPLGAVASWDKINTICINVLKLITWEIYVLECYYRRSHSHQIVNGTQRSKFVL